MAEAPIGPDLVAVAVQNERDQRFSGCAGAMAKAPRNVDG
jgi:hypothetical protein